MSTAIRTTAGFTAGAGPFNLAIPPTGAGNALAIVGINFGGGTRVITSNSTGLWTQVFDNASYYCAWVCTNPGTGTTQVTFSATGSGFNLYVVEASGLKNGGATYAAAENAGGPAASWISNSISPSQSVMAIGMCYQGSASSPTSTMAGWNLATDTGISAGNITDTSSGDVLVVGTLDLAPGAGQTAAGLWGSSVPYNANIFAFELAPAGAGSSDQALLMML